MVLHVVPLAWWGSSPLVGLWVTSILLVCWTAKDTNRTTRCRHAFRFAVSPWQEVVLVQTSVQLNMFPVLEHLWPRADRMRLSLCPVSGSCWYGYFVGGHGRCQRILRRARGRAGTWPSHPRDASVPVLVLVCFASPVSSCSHSSPSPYKHVDACVSIQLRVAQQDHR